MRLCEQCGISIKRRRFCGRVCYGLSLQVRGVKPPSRKGILHSPETRSRMSVAIKATVPRGSAHYQWKGDEVGIKALHEWVYQVRGRPMRCEHCGSVEHLDWANKSHEYKRDAEDWLSLCRRCHMKYDDTGKTIWNKRRQSAAA